MPRNGSGVYSLPAGSTFTPNTLIQSAVVNSINTDIATDMNTPRPIVAGGTGATTAAGAAAALLVYSTTTPICGFRNQIINGDFTIWQRGTTQSTSGYGADDRWLNGNTGTTKVHSQQSFTLGQTAVPGNPGIFSRTVVTSVAGASNFCNKLQKIESVNTLPGQTATLTFYAKSDAPRNMAVEFIQTFGTGGSPSADVSAIGVTTIALTTNWQRFNVLVSLPSVSGKTVGSNGNSALIVQFWFDAGSSFNSRTNSLGQQSGTFDISHVSLVQGDARTEADPFSPRHVQEELSLCQRYYEAGSVFSQAPAASTQGVTMPYSVTKRAAPTRAFNSITYSGASALTDQSASFAFQPGAFVFNFSASAASGYVTFGWTADAEL